MSLDNLSRDLLNVAKSFKDEKKSKQFMQKTGTKLQKKTLEVAKTTVKAKTGNYFNSIKRGKVYNYDGSLNVRAYTAAPHGHLIEHDHIIKTKNGEEKKKEGYHIFEKAAVAFEDEFESDVEAFVDEIFEENGF